MSGKQYKLWAHQLLGVTLGLLQDTFALFFEVGTGKTATAIRILCERMNLLQRNLRVIVFCPPVVCINWKREFGMFSDIDQSKIQVLNGQLCSLLGSNCLRRLQFMPLIKDDELRPKLLHLLK